MASNSKPAAELRIGAVKATVWENEVGGITRHNVTFSRIYRDEDQWKTTHSFGFKNLLTLAKLADQAHTLIAERKAEAAETLAAEALSVGKATDDREAGQTAAPSGGGFTPVAFLRFVAPVLRRSFVVPMGTGYAPLTDA